MTRVKLIKVLILIFSLLVCTHKSWACVCERLSNERDYKSSFEADNTLIFTGKVIKVELIQNNISGNGAYEKDVIKTTFYIEKNFKGVNSQELTIEQDRTCAYPYYTGSFYLVHANDEEGKIIESACEHPLLVGPRNTDVLKEIKDLTKWHFEKTGREIPLLFDVGRE